jgi:hypothetical protein
MDGLSGLAGIGLTALVRVHVYFAVRPEKLDIAASMVFGTMKREFYLRHYDTWSGAVRTMAMMHAMIFCMPRFPAIPASLQKVGTRHVLRLPMTDAGHNAVPQNPVTPGS